LDFEREWATTAPVRFFFRTFLRLAATVALVMAVLDVAWPAAALSSKPSYRLTFIFWWSLAMAVLELLAARKLRRRG
jgi:hypothetical protein